MSDEPVSKLLKEIVKEERRLMRKLQETIKDEIKVCKHRACSTLHQKEIEVFTVLIASFFILSLFPA